MAPDLDCITPEQPMEGYLKKAKKWTKRYFVLRDGPPPCLEYYDSAKRKHGKPKRIIDLKNAWCIDKKVSSKHKHLIGIYTEGGYFSMAAENDTTQEAWVRALKKAVQGSKGRVNATHLMYKHIWHGTVDTKDLDGCDAKTKLNLQGLHRCCLTDKTMVFVRLNNSGSCNLQAHTHIEVSISSIRSCGHRDNLFFMEPGRSSGIGTGKLWMELEDPSIADNMHKSLLDLMKSGDDDRQRSYSFGSTTGRPSINRSRHYYNPPPSQVGLGKPASSTTLSKQASFIGCRNRCESFPATQAATLTDESRYRTSSEGETTMKRPHPFHSLAFPKYGSISPNARSRVIFKRPPYLQSSFFHFRLPTSLPGSYTSSSNSSIEHINMSHDCFQNGHSPATSESHGSSDEFSCSPLTDLGSQSHIRYALINYSGDLGLAPPPPPMAALTTPLTTVSTSSTSTTTLQTGEYASMQPSHSRSHSLDDNLSCGTAASSLSASPQTTPYLPGVSPDTSYLYSQSPSQSSSHSHNDVVGQIFTPTSASPDEYSMMSPGCSEAYPHEASQSKEQNLSDYTPMTPGRGVVATSTPVEDKSGYVPMRPLARSQPQDIVPRRRSLSDNRLVNGSYSPASPLSRSPDKIPLANRSLPVNNVCVKCKRDLPHSYPCQCSSMTITAKGPSIPTFSCHGLKVDAKNDFSFDSNRPMNYATKTPKPNEQPPSYYTDEYAKMDGLTRNVTVASSSSSPRNTPDDTKEFSSNEPDVDHEYLPMSPMNAANSKKSVVSNVLSVVESASKSNSTGGSVIPKYPHQRSVSKPDYCTNSLDRSSSKQRKRTKSLFGTSLVPGHRISRTSKPGRKSSLRLNIESKTATSETSSSSVAPPLSPGGEYVSISFDKAKKQVGPDYVSLTESSALPTTSPSNQLPNTLTVTHDSNRNIVPAKSPKDEYTLLKPGDEREAQL